MKLANPPRTGRELAEYLADHPLVRVSFWAPRGGWATTFVAAVIAIEPRGITLQAIGRGRPVVHPMPAKWNAEGKVRKSAQESHHIKEMLSFDESGFDVCGTRFEYLDERNPFA